MSRFFWRTSPCLAMVLWAAGCAGGSTDPGAMTLMLTGEGNYLRLNGAPANSSYVGMYPNPTKVHLMVIEMLANGELAQSCPDSHSDDCIDSPFYSKITPKLGGAEAKVYDLYGTVVAELDLGTGNDGKEQGSFAIPTLSGSQGSLEGPPPGSVGSNSPTGSDGRNDRSGNGGTSGGTTTTTGQPGSYPGCPDSYASGEAQTAFCDGIMAELRRRNIDTFTLDCSVLNDSVSYSYSLLGRLGLAGVKADSSDNQPPVKRCKDIATPVRDQVMDKYGKCYVVNNWFDKTRSELKKGGVCKSSPIVLDLGGDGVALSSVEKGVSFDLLATGEPVQCAWPAGADDALLVFDRNHNGQIDGAEELFGNSSDARTFGDGFDALAEFDDNHDGLIDAKDSIFASLRLWRDRDRNGQAARAELESLDHAAVQALDLGATRISDAESWDQFGNQLQLRSAFLRKDGTHGVMVDAFLRFAPSAARLNQDQTEQVLRQHLGPLF